MDMTEAEGKTGNIAQAETAAELEATLDTENEKLQQRMGIKDPAKVKLYQGDSEEIKQADAVHNKKASHAANKASFDEQNNQINYNTSPKDARKIENVVSNLAHENTHKAISETKFAKKHINKDQEESVARQVEWTAKHASKIAKNKQGSHAFQPSKLDDIAWNKQNKDALQANNQRLASVDPEVVKPRVLEKFDKDYWAALKKGDKEEAARIKADWEKVEDKACKVARSFIPVVGSATEACEAFDEGKYVEGSLYTALAVAEAVPFVTLASKGLKAGGIASKMAAAGEKALMSEVVVEGAEVVGKANAQFTVSNLKLGQEMHTAYKAGVADYVTTFKEFRDIKGIRPDFVDLGTKTIYELKPFNPRGIQMGTQQLNKYKFLFEQKYGGTWNTILDFY
jgi:hypothetical protein